MLYFLQQGRGLSPASPPTATVNQGLTRRPPTVPIYQRKRIVPLPETPVSTHFPSVSKIIQLIKRAVLISCLGAQEEQNFIGG